jgi:hypothetical protein
MLVNPTPDDLAIQRVSPFREPLVQRGRRVAFVVRRLELLSRHSRFLVHLAQPRCIERELANNPQQHQASDDARQLQQLPPVGRNVVHEGVPYVLTPRIC